VFEPVWARWLSVPLLAAVSACCLLRLLTGRRSTGAPARHEDIGQVVMGIAMIAMLLSWVNLIPRAVWVFGFAVQATVFGWLLLRGRQPKHAPAHDAWQNVHHLVASLAMVYLMVALAGTVSVRHPMALPALAGSFATYFVVYSGWSVLRVAATGAAGSTGLLRQPRLVEGCRAAMGLGMAAMLLAIM